MSEFDSPSYVEYEYDKKAEGKTRLFKYLLIIGYVAFVVLFFCICYITRLVPLFAVCPIVTWILIHFTWQFVSYDVYYTFEHGHITLGKIKRRKSGKMRSPTVELDVQKAILITSYKNAIRTDEYKSSHRVRNFASTLGSDNIIAIVYEVAGDRETVIFENTPKLAKLIPKYSAVAKDTEYN